MNEEQKLCPLFSIGNAMAGCEDCECYKEKCMWYIADKRKCAITVIGGKK